MKLIKNILLKLKISSIKNDLYKNVPYDLFCGRISGKEAISESIYLKNKLDEQISKCN